MKTKGQGILLLTGTLFLIVGLLWFANRFGGGENVESEKPRIVCKTQNQCFWTAHIHAIVKVFKGGQQVQLNFEQGKLEEEHTHSERDKLHWHGLIPVDPTTNSGQVQEVKDWAALQVKNLPKDLGLTIQGEPKFIVNGQEVSPDYIWKDGDEIQINF